MTSAATVGRGVTGIIALVACSSLWACSVGPDYVRPELAVPSTWQEASAGDSSPDLHRWWTTLGDSHLDGLVDRALAGNLDLRQAVSRVDEARALYTVAASARFPLIDAQGDIDHQRASENAIAPGTGESDTAYDIGVAASWEVDVFGRVRRSVESAEAGMEASEEERRDVLLAVCAEVAATYVDIRTFQHRLQVAYANLDSQREIVELTQARFDDGIASGLDLAQAESVYAETRTELPTIELLLDQSFNRLSVLLGENPGSVRQLLTIFWALPEPPDRLDAGLPVDLVRRRPDIRQAERELAAATARIGIAKADLYPRFTLLGTFAFDSSDVGTLFNGASRAYSVGPAVRWNVFDAGRIRGFIHAEEARTQQALAHYEQTVLQALSEVENALIAFSRLRDEEEGVIDAVRASTRSLDLATELYKDGLADFQNVLDAQRTVLRFQDRLVITEGAILQSVIQLYRALGGGWEGEAEPPQDANEPHHDAVT